MSSFEIGSFAGLSQIHHYLYQDIYSWAGKVRTTNLVKGTFRFTSNIYLQPALNEIDSLNQNNYDQIIEKYVEMNIAHPFKDGNGRAMRIWLNQILKQEIGMIVDWNEVEKDQYLSAMVMSPISDLPIKELLKAALRPKELEKEILYKGIDASYYFEG